jgi:hypothetical protein
MANPFAASDPLKRLAPADFVIITPVGSVSSTFDQILAASLQSAQAKSGQHDPPDESGEELPSR